MFLVPTFCPPLINSPPLISNKVQGHNSPLPKTLLTKIPTLTAIWSSQHEGEEDVASSDKRENKYEQIDGGEEGGG